MDSAASVDGPVSNQAIRSETGPNSLPDALAIAETTARIQAILDEEKFSYLVNFLSKLLDRPPAVLLLEGGTAELRRDTALLWAAWLNCPVYMQSLAMDQQSSLLNGPEGTKSQPASPPPRPCLACSHCVRMVMGLHRDCFYLDGLAESIKIGTLRDTVRPYLGEPPREARYRAVIFREAQTMTPDAANLMLKSLEEPVSATSFVLTAPQRERLMPTLVSRSMILTLPWTTAGSANEVSDNLLSCEVTICRFLRNGQGLFQMTGQRGAMDTHSAQAIVNLCRKALALAMGKGVHGQPLGPLTHDSCPAGLWEILGAASLPRQRTIDEVLSKAQEYILAGVNPAATLEWVLTRIYFLVR